MYKIVQGSTGNLTDVESFIKRLNTPDQSPIAEARGLFDNEADLILTRAPGRLDVMGGIADYSGSLVLQMPTREAAVIALQRDPERSLRVVSFGAEANNRAASFYMRLDDFERGGQPIDYAAARDYFQREPATRWAAYVAGSLLVLMRELQLRFDHGARILIDSRVPEGKGVSSSAAIEVAVMRAVAQAFGISINSCQMALLCQKVENCVVGAPCGVMDQMAVACGEENRLLALLCQPAQLQEAVQIPEEIGVWGIDSGVRHSVSGADYASVRVGAFMGYRMIAEFAGLLAFGDQAGNPVHIADEKWKGYLANITPSEFEQRYHAHLPQQITGSEFARRYGYTTDPITRVQAERNYLVRMPTAHPIYEHFRVRSFAEMLRHRPSGPGLELLGEMMYQSHASYSACGLGSAGTDLLVELVRRAGPSEGLYGAKITGGGSGGTVAVLGRKDARARVHAIAEQYASETGHPPLIFSGSSPGAEAFGHLRLTASR
jgi:galactokinase